MVVCLERGADLHMAQLMPLPLTASCFSKIQIGFTFLVPAQPGSPGKGPLNGYVCVCHACGRIGSADERTSETEFIQPVNEMSTHAFGQQRRVELHKVRRRRGSDMVRGPISDATDF